MTDTVTLADILAKIRQQLDWRGESGGLLPSHVMLLWADADALYDKVMAILHERDELRHALEHPAIVSALDRAGAGEDAPKPVPEAGPDQHLAPQFHHEADRHRQ